MTTSTFFITGLTCDHCVNAIKEEVGEIAGVTNIEVELVKGGKSTLTIEADRPSRRSISPRRSRKLARATPSSTNPPRTHPQPHAHYPGRTS